MTQTSLQSHSNDPLPQSQRPSPPVSATLSPSLNNPLPQSQQPSPPVSTTLSPSLNNPLPQSQQPSPPVSTTLSPSLNDPLPQSQRPSPPVSYTTWFPVTRLLLVIFFFKGMGKPISYTQHSELPDMQMLISDVEDYLYEYLV